MGLGDVLMWTAVVREMAINKNMSNIQIIKHSKGKPSKLTKHELFKNNPYICQPLTEDQSTVGDEIAKVSKVGTLQRIHFGHGHHNGEELFHYLKSFNNTKKTFADNYTHVITQYCRHFNICSDPTLKCEIYFSDSEEKKISSLIACKLNNKPFIVIEPHSKREYMSFPFEKFQNVVDALKDKIQFVQVGLRTKKKLKNIIDLTGYSIRESALIIKHSKQLVCPEGGLMHVANAVGTPAVVLMTGIMHPGLTCYPENYTIWQGADHGPCNLLNCAKCKAGTKSLDTSLITNYLDKILI
jgi:ADP-heptose:LPS heptosyltransferase